MTLSDGVWLFSENHASTLLEHDAPVIVETSSACCFLALSPATLLLFLLPSPPPHIVDRTTIRNWWTNARSHSSWRMTTPSKRQCSTALLPSSEIELVRNGSGSWSRGVSRLFPFFFFFFFYLSIVSKAILARSCSASFGRYLGGVRRR